MSELQIKQQAYTMETAHWLKLGHTVAITWPRSQLIKVIKCVVNTRVNKYTLVNTVQEY